MLLVSVNRLTHICHLLVLVLIVPVVVSVVYAVTIVVVISCVIHIGSGALIYHYCVLTSRSQVPTTHTGDNTSNDRYKYKDADDNHKIDPPEVPDIPEIVPGVTGRVQRITRRSGTEPVVVAATCCTVLSDTIAAHCEIVMNNYIL